MLRGLSQRPMLVGVLDVICGIRCGILRLSLRNRLRIEMFKIDLNRKIWGENILLVICETWKRIGSDLKLK